MGQKKLLLWAAGVGVGVMEGGCGQRVGEARMGLWQSAGVIVGFRFGEELYEQRRNGLAGAEVRMSWPSRWPFPGDSVHPRSDLSSGWLIDSWFSYAKFTCEFSGTSPHHLTRTELLYGAPYTPQTWPPVSLSQSGARRLGVTLGPTTRAHAGSSISLEFIHFSQPSASPS